ncbi:MAG: AAA domain-containing protein [bacterium]|nr:AAA domain-containing protein [bacterium]
MIDWNSLERFADTPIETLETEMHDWVSRPDMRMKAAEEAVQNRLLTLRNRTAAALLHRDKLVDCVVASLVSGVPMVVLGPPGTGKSLCVRLLSEACRGGKTNDRSRRISKTYFEYLLTSHTMPEELFGPPDLERLRNGVFERRTENMLPESEFAFLDEVFRGGPHILNTLLSILNERRFHDGAASRELPLLGVVAASNSVPSDPDVAAFFDRFPIRIWVSSVLEDNAGSTTGDFGGTLSELLKKSGDHELRRTGARTDSADSYLACTNDFRAGAAMLRAQRFGFKELNTRGEEFAEAAKRVRARLGLSDRGLTAVWRFGAALDWLKGRSITGSHSIEGCTGHLDALEFAASSPQLAEVTRQAINDVKHGQGVQSAH